MSDTRPTHAATPHEPASAKSTDLVAVEHSLHLADRWQMNGHRSGILWFSGLPGATKKTLALARGHALPESMTPRVVIVGATGAESR